MITKTQAVRCVFVLLASIAAYGAPPDVIVTGSSYAPGIIPIPYPPWVYPLEWGDLWSEVPTEPYSGFVMIAAGGHGRLLAIDSAETYPPHLRILEIRADKTRTELFSMNSFGNGLVADATGNIFVLASSLTRTEIVVLNRRGTLLRTYAVGGGTYGPFLQRIELASDQCTLFYELSRLHRFNVCTGTPLPDFPGIGSHPAVLPDGDIVLSYYNQLWRYNQDGSLVRNYLLGRPLYHGGPGPVGLSANGHRALLTFGRETQVYEVDLDTGAVTVRPEVLTVVRGWVTAIVPMNGWTAALGSAAIATSDVPALTTTMLASLFGLLAFVALRKLAA